MRRVGEFSGSETRLYRLRSRYAPFTGATNRRGGLSRRILQLFLPQESKRKLAGHRQTSLRSQGGLLEVSELKLGLPKGSLEVAMIELCKRSGWNVSSYRRRYFPSVGGDSLRCRLASSQE